MTSLHTRCLTRSQVAFSQLCVVYYATAVLLHYIVPSIARVKSVQNRPRSSGQVRREALQSIGTCVFAPPYPSPAHVGTGPLAVKAAVWVIVERLHATGCSKLYDWPSSTAPQQHLATPIISPGNASITATAQPDAPDHTKQMLWGLLCVALLDALHDTWFYWTHRLLHWKPLYKHVHYMHHRCVVERISVHLTTGRSA